MRNNLFVFGHSATVLHTLRFATAALLIPLVLGASGCSDSRCEDLEQGCSAGSYFLFKTDAPQTAPMVYGGNIKNVIQVSPGQDIERALADAGKSLGMTSRPATMPNADWLWIESGNTLTVYIKRGTEPGDLTMVRPRPRDDRGSPSEMLLFEVGTQKIPTDLSQRFAKALLDRLRE